MACTASAEAPAMAISDRSRTGAQRVAGQDTHLGGGEAQVDDDQRRERGAQRAHGLAKNAQHEPERAEAAGQQPCVAEPGGEGGRALGGRIDGHQARGADAASQVELEVRGEWTQCQEERGECERGDRTGRKLKRDVRPRPTAREQRSRQQRDAQRQRGGVRFDGGRCYERAEQERAPASLHANRDPDRR